MSRQVPESFPGARLVSYERIHRHGHDIKIRLVPGGVILLVKPSNGNVGSDLCTRDHGRDFDSRVHGQPSNFPFLLDTYFHSLWKGIENNVPKGIHQRLTPDWWIGNNLHLLKGKLFPIACSDHTSFLLSKEKKWPARANYSVENALAGERILADCILFFHVG